MRKVSLRNLSAHRLRLALTVLAVVLGTAFIAGSFIFTSTLSKSFDSIVSTSFDGVDVVVSGGEDHPEGISQEDAGRIAGIEGVGNVNATSESATIVATDPQGKAIQSGGAGGQALPYYPADKTVGTLFDIVDGAAPTRPGEVLLNDTAAKTGGVSVGDRISVVGAAGRTEVTVTGLWHNDTSTGGWVGVVFPEEQWRELFTDGEHVEGLALSVNSSVPGMDAETLRDRLREAYPDYSIETGASVAEELSRQITQALSFITYFLMAFGLIALLVGTFIISNTFSMIVAQRTREFALLRALGASRRQLTNSVVIEAVIVGAIGSVLGIAVGFGLVALLQWGMSAAGLGLPTGGLAGDWQSIVWPLIIGIIVTVISAWSPAARAGRTPPVQAMRSGDASSSASLTVRTAIGAVVLAAGAALAVTGALGDAWSTGTRSYLVGGGSLLVILAVWMVSPWLSIPLVGGLGRMLGLPFGSTGRLAATNSRRNPRRTSATAFALTLGLALVSSIGMLGATTKASLEDLIGQQLTSDLVLAAPQSGALPIPTEAVNRVRELDGVKSVGTFGAEPIQLVNPADAAAAGSAAGASQVDAAMGLGFVSIFDGNLPDYFAVETAGGNLDLTDPAAGVVTDESTAEKEGWQVGDPVTAVGPTGQVETTVTGIYRNTEVFSGSFLSPAVADQVVVDPAQRAIGQAFLVFDEGADPQQTRNAVENTVGEYIVVQVMDAEEFQGQVAVQVNQMLTILYGLLALAIIIAVLGIVNTLALSVIERRREIGMLRAVGMHRSQIRQMIYLESIQIAVYGAVLGALVGLGLGWCFIKVMGDDGLSTVVVPWGQIIGMVVASGVVGVLAALWPAEKAARTNPLAAIAED